MQVMQMLSQDVTNLICAPLLHGEFDPGSGRTLAACLIQAGYPRVTHPSAADLREQAPVGPLDLHVLGTPPAFVLSQDQTLHEV